MINMKKIVALFFFFNLSKSVFATEQAADLLLIGNDTIYLKTFPLESLKLKHPPFGSSDWENTGCWRKYWAVWRLENDTLYLEKIFDCMWLDSTRQEENVIELFRKNGLEKFIRNGRVVASWYNTILVKYPYFIYDETRIYLSEPYTIPVDKFIMMRFAKGVLIENRLKDYKFGQP